MRKIIKLMNLYAVKQFLTNLPNKQLFINRCESLRLTYNGNGGALLCGTMIENLFYESFPKIQKYNKGENDVKILDIPFSFKKITGNSALAYNWSKNETIKPIFFQSPMLILKLKTTKWDRKVLKTGIYLIEKKNLQKIQFSCNNKTNSLIEAKVVCQLLQKSIAKKLFIPFPRLPEYPYTLESHNFSNGFQ